MAAKKKSAKKSSKKPSAAQLKARENFAKMARSKGKKGGAAKAASKSAKKAGKKGRKLTASQKSALRAGAKAYWNARRGSGTKASHIPLKQLKKNKENLSKLIAKRESQGGWN